ncbi:MAG: primosomal protein N' [Ktedonobacterales bacterium]|nr:primosomal protein N' [Ktedonobacterales bacterium]
MEQPDRTLPLFAHVLVLHGAAWGDQRHAPIFVYTIPAELSAQSALGQMVLAPFGAQLVNGIIWVITRDAEGVEAERLRAIRAVLDPTPLLDGPHRALADWLAETYLCTLVEAVRIVAAGMTAKPKIDLVAPADHTLTSAPLVAAEDDADARALLGLLGSAGHADEGTVRRALGTKRAAALITTLEARGALSRVAHPETSRTVVPDALVRLVGDVATIAQWRQSAQEQLAGTPPQALTVHPVAVRSKRGGRGALLQRIATAGTTAALAPPAPSTRELVRLRAALAVTDLLVATPEGARPRREVLRLTRATPAALAMLERAGIVATEDAPAVTVAHAVLAGAPPLALLPGQAEAVAHIIAAQDAATELALWSAADGVPDAETTVAARPILLHGITGSGKTEVYLRALAAAVARGRRGLVLVPEIALTPQTVSRFAARFPGRVALLHSGLRPQDRQREWRRIRSGAVDVVVGSRSAIFAPLPDLGLIILDEEHDGSYKQDGRAPTYHAREVALTLARLTGSAVVLGSATPATETYHRAQAGEFALLELHERPNPQPLPPVTIVDLRAELHEGHTSILSRELLTAMAENLARGEQTILYLNRRGAATCVLCRDCGYPMRCGRCDVPLTHHQHEDKLICHYCNWRETPPKVCYRCGSNAIRFFGVGTERVESTVRELFPQARVLRWDADTVRGYGDHAGFARALAEKQVDIMVGTQMIAKGLDVPGVTLVGIVAADVALYLPDYRAPERAFQLLTQVAGRAGRGDAPGRVILQTFSPDHFCIQAAANHDFAAFYAIEIASRQSYNYPPFRRFVKLTYTHKDRHTCQTEAISLGDHLARLIDNLGLTETDIVGPAPAFIERLRNHYRWQIVLRGPDPRVVIAALTPQEVGSGWTIDIDPTSLL